MLIKKLCEANGLPNNESEIRKMIREELAGHVDELLTDRMGNVIAVKNKNAAGKHLALSAHMDEAGLMVTWIEDSGLLRFESLGCDLRVLPAKVVLVGKNNVPGVIGTKPIHLQKREERQRAVEQDDMYIDIGAKHKEDAEKLVELGDPVAFKSSFVTFGEHKVKAKALDDRVGCALIIDILKSDTPYKVTGIFCTQEEVGMRGSVTAANQVFADLVLNLEGTLCADTEGIKEADAVTTQGCGPAISILDRTSVYLKDCMKDVTDCANQNGIPWQYRRTGMGGTDSKNYHIAHGGTPVVGIAVPCRYIHSPVSVMDMRDFENAGELLKAYIPHFNQN